MIGIFAAVLLIGSSASLQAPTNAELRAQLEQTRAAISQAEAAGAPADLIASLRNSMAELERSLDEDAASAAPAPAVAQSADATPPYPIRPNALNNDPACAGFTMENYRERGLAEGNDAQLRTMCAQAFEYYHMYLNAIRQGYSEADANRTYDAHAAAARNASAFFANNRSH